MRVWMKLSPSFWCREGVARVAVKVTGIKEPSEVHSRLLARLCLGWLNFPWRCQEAGC